LTYTYPYCFWIFLSKLFLDEIIIAGPDFGHLDLSCLPRLRSFHVRIHDINAVCDALASIHESTELESVTIHTIAWPLQGGYSTIASCSRELVWGSVNEIFNRRNFLKLRMLKVVVPMYYDEEGLLIVRECLGGCERRGILTLNQE
jgi:hypothetical protein